MRWILTALLAVVLSGCAKMDVAECQSADWRAIGYGDGVEGRGPSAFGALRKACAKHGFTADFASYRVGRDEGLVHFCRAPNAYRLGTRGYRYGGVCPARLEGAFLAAHAEGYGLYTRALKVKRLGKRLRGSKQRAQEVERLLAEKMALLLSPEAALQERAELAVAIRQLAEEKVRLDARRRRLEGDHAAAERDYERYHERLAARPWD